MINKQTFCRYILHLAMLSWMVIGLSASAETSDIDDETSQVGVNAMATLQKFAQFLSNTKQFSFIMESGYDVVQDSGFKLEFGARHNITVQRPNHARIEVTRRGGEKRIVNIDGKEISVADPNDNVYAVVSKSGSLNDAIDYFTNDLQMTLPLAELFYDNFPNIITDKVITAHTVGEATIAQVLCEHLVIQNDEVDIQIWIEKGDQPLPRRIVITYRNEIDKPQFKAQFIEWNLSPQISKSLFTFKPPKDAHKIEFAPIITSEAQMGEEQ